MRELSGTALSTAAGFGCCQKRPAMVGKLPKLTVKKVYMQKILKEVHAHMPYELLPSYLDLILQKKINPEIYFNHSALDNLDKEECLRIAATLKEAGLKITFHAPFMDLRPGALDKSIRQASLNRIRQAFDLAFIFRPLRIVCHPSFDHRYYVSCDELWLQNSAATWRELLDMAAQADTVIALENTYEKEPSILRRLLEMLPSERLCFCFDTGHFNVFSATTLDIWLAELGKYIGQLHLHDNYGKTDEHLPVGNGIFPFARLFQFLREEKINPVITLEAHAASDLQQSATNIEEMGLFKGMV